MKGTCSVRFRGSTGDHARRMENPWKGLSKCEGVDMTMIDSQLELKFNLL